MSNVEMLRFLVNQKLSVAVEEICGLVERTIAEYEEQLCRSKEENERQQKLLDAVFNPQLRLHRADIQEVSENKTEIPSEQQDWSPTANQEDTERPRIKEEQEEVWSSQQGLEEVYPTKLSITPALVKDEDGEQILESSQLHQIQTGRIKTEADGEECGEQEEARTSDSVSNLEPEAEDKNEDGSEVKTGAGDDWRDREDHQSAFNNLEHFSSRSSNINRKSNSCLAAFNNNQEQIQHMTIYSREKLFSCSEFDNRIISQPRLTKHLLHSPGDKILRCTECYKTFKHKSSLSTHMKIHRGEKPFCCSQCDKRFIKRCHLSTHMTVHTGEKPKPFCCSQCDKRFINRSYLNSHMAIHTGEKPYSCKVCGLRFAWRNQLRRHECLGGLALVNENKRSYEGDCATQEPDRNSDTDKHVKPD